MHLLCKRLNIFPTHDYRSEFIETNLYIEFPVLCIHLVRTQAIEHVVWYRNYDYIYGGFEFMYIENVHSF